MMAKEAKGTNGRILGSLNYFSLINEKFPQKSLLKDRTRANYFLWLGNSITKVKKVLESIDGKKIQAFFQFAVNSICSDIKKSVAKGEFADFEHRENLRTALKQLEKCGYKVPSSIYDEIKKLRKLEDFHKKIINLDFRGAQYPVEVWLEWKNGKNILHIHVKVCFKKQLEDGTIINDDSNEIYITDGLDEMIYTKKQAVLKGFEKWSGNYHVFNSAEEGKQDLQVICTAEEMHSENINALPVFIEIDIDVSSTSSLLDWSQEHPAIEMHLHYIKPHSSSEEHPGDFTYRSFESFSNAAKHEFGHVLGLRDAYTKKEEMGHKDISYSEYPDIKEDAEEVGIEVVKGKDTKMVMNTNGAILNNDIEMLILAWREGKFQYFHLDAGGDHISEALGR